MGRIRSTIDEATRQFIESQPVFFVASSPLDGNGHINISPKGLDTLRILSPSTVAYLDLTGSGIETVAHIRENGRLVLMFCAFNGPPTILRLHGRGRVVEPKDAEFETLVTHFPRHDSTRSIVVLDVTRVANLRLWRAADEPRRREAATIGLGAKERTGRARSVSQGEEHPEHRRVARRNRVEGCQPSEVRRHK